MTGQNLEDMKRHALIALNLLHQSKKSVFVNIVSFGSTFSSLFIESSEMVDAIYEMAKS